MWEAPCESETGLQGAGKPQGKVFVGGLSWETTDAKLRVYFENYGSVQEAFVSYDRATGRPRGFGFVVFEDSAVADHVVSLTHTIDRREVEAKKAVPKVDAPARPAGLATSTRTKKIFVGGLAPSVDEKTFRAYFELFGDIEDAVVLYDHDNKRPRGFGFITFTTEAAVEQVFTQGAIQSLHDKPIEIKRAVPREQMAAATAKTPRAVNAAAPGHRSPFMGELPAFAKPPTSPSPGSPTGMGGLYSSLLLPRQSFDSPTSGSSGSGHNMSIPAVRHRADLEGRYQGYLEHQGRHSLDVRSRHHLEHSLDRLSAQSLPAHTHALQAAAASDAFSLFSNDGLAERGAPHPLQRHSVDSHLLRPYQLAPTSSLGPHPSYGPYPSLAGHSSMGPAPSLGAGSLFSGGDSNSLGSSFPWSKQEAREQASWYPSAAPSPPPMPVPSPLPNPWAKPAPPLGPAALYSLPALERLYLSGTSAAYPGGPLGGHLPSDFMGLPTAQS